MDPKLIRKALGLSPEASDEEVEAKLKVQAEAQPQPPAEEPAPEEEPAEEPAPEEPPAEEQPPAAEEEGESATVTVDRKVWEETVANAKDGKAARDEQIVERREGILAAAVKAGKITVASKEDWRKKLVSAPEATERELDELAPGLVAPVDEKGTAAPAAGEAQVASILKGAFGIDPARAGLGGND